MLSGWIYYAGHGLQVGGINYLVPVDANIDRERGDVAIESDQCGRSSEGFAPGPEQPQHHHPRRLPQQPVSWLFARCHARARRGSMHLRDHTSFLRRHQATWQPTVTGDNSPFTQALATHFTTPGLNVEQIIKRVGRDVSRVTGGRQRPWLSSSVYDDFFPAGRGVRQVGNGCTSSRRCASRQSQPCQSKPTAASGHRRKSRLKHQGTEVFRDCKNCPEMIVVPAGRFTMGSLNDAFRDRNQTPVSRGDRSPDRSPSGVSKLRSINGMPAAEPVAAHATTQATKSGDAGAVR